MKWNWGKGLTAAIIFFMIITLTMVYIAQKQEFNLVSSNYYESAITYDNLYQRMQNSALGKNKIRLFQEVNNNLELKFPSDAKLIKGSILFYKSSNSDLDKVINISTDSINTQKIQANFLSRGNWLIKITWDSSSSVFYQEFSISI